MADSTMDRHMRKFPHSDTDVRFCKSQNARLLEQNKKLMSQLEEMSRKLSMNSRSTTSFGAVEGLSLTEDEVEDDFGQKLSVSRSVDAMRGKREVGSRSRCVQGHCECVCVSFCLFLSFFLSFFLPHFLRPFLFPSVS